MQARLPEVVGRSLGPGASALHVLVVDVRGVDLPPADLARGGLRVQVKYGQKGRSAACDLGEVTRAAASPETSGKASGGADGLAHVPIGAACMFRWCHSAGQILRFQVASRHGVSHVAKDDIAMDFLRSAELCTGLQLDLRRHLPALPSALAGRLHVSIRRHKVRVGDLRGTLADLNAHSQPGGSFLFKPSGHLVKGALELEELHEHDGGLPLSVGVAVR